MTVPPSPGPPGRGVVRLLNTAGGPLLVFAGNVDGPVVEDFLRRYGREPARIDGIDAASVTSLSASGLELLRAHLDAAELAGRTVPLRRTPEVDRLLAAPTTSSRPVPEHA